MSVNVNQAIGEAIIQECERLGFKLWLDGDSAQIRIRDAMADPKDNSSAERTRAAEHTPRMLPGAMTSELNNKRGSVLVALRIRAARNVDPVALDTKPAAQPSIPVINRPGYGDAIDPTADIA